MYMYMFVHTTCTCTCACKKADAAEAESRAARARSHARSVHRTELCATVQGAAQAPEACTMLRFNHTSLRLVSSPLVPRTDAREVWSWCARAVGTDVSISSLERNQEASNRNGSPLEFFLAT